MHAKSINTNIIRSLINFKRNVVSLIETLVSASELAAAAQMSPSLEENNNPLSNFRILYLFDLKVTLSDASLWNRKVVFSF